MRVNVQRVVPGMWYQGGGAGGRGLLPEKLAMMLFVKPTAGSAGMLREQACGMRVVRPRRKESVGYIVVGKLYEGTLQANAGTESWEGDLETRGRYEELVRSKWKG